MLHLNFFLFPTSVWRFQPQKKRRQQERKIVMREIINKVWRIWWISIFVFCAFASTARFVEQNCLLEREDYGGSWRRTNNLSSYGFGCIVFVVHIFIKLTSCEPSWKFPELCYRNVNLLQHERDLNWFDLISRKSVNMPRRGMGGSTEKKSRPLHSQNNQLPLITFIHISS